MTGILTLVTSNETDPSNDYVSYSHGLYNRNAHGQEILLRPTNITWRALGGSIDLYFYAGPRATDAIASFQQSAAGLPAMQQYFTLGFHQCRWGYANWSQVEEVVDDFAKFDLPLDNIWTDVSEALVLFLTVKGQASMPGNVTGRLSAHPFKLSYVVMYSFKHF